MAAPISVALTYSRGDSAPIPFEATDPDTAAVVDITGFSFILTVDPEPDPTDASGNLMTLTGVITDATNGKFQFTPTTTESNFTPDSYFYDIQQINASTEKQTIIAGAFTLRQDVTKT